MRWFFVVLLAALIVSVTWWKISSRSSALPAGVAESPNAGTNQPLSDSGAAHRNPRPPISPAELTRSNHLRHEQAEAKKAKVVDAGRNKLVARYQNEKVEGGWATGREQSLVEHSVSPQIHDLGADPKNLTAHCRSSTCKLTADFPTRSAAYDWFTMYLTNPGTDLYNASYQATMNDDGTAHVEIYGLAKQP